jgi:hypothetical protein
MKAGVAIEEMTKIEIAIASRVLIETLGSLGVLERDVAFLFSVRFFISLPLTG